MKKIYSICAVGVLWIGANGQGHNLSRFASQYRLTSDLGTDPIQTPIGQGAVFDQTRDTVIAKAIVELESDSEAISSKKFRQPSDFTALIGQTSSILTGLIDHLEPKSSPMLTAANSALGALTGKTVDYQAFREQIRELTAAYSNFCGGKTNTELPVWDASAGGFLFNEKAYGFGSLLWSSRDNELHGYRGISTSLSASAGDIATDGSDTGRLGVKASIGNADGFFAHYAVSQFFSPSVTENELGLSLLLHGSEDAQKAAGAYVVGSETRIRHFERRLVDNVRAGDCWLYADGRAFTSGISGDSGSGGEVGLALGGPNASYPSTLTLSRIVYSESTLGASEWAASLRFLLAGDVARPLYLGARYGTGHIPTVFLEYRFP